MNKTLVAFTLLIATSFAAITTNVDLSTTLSSSNGIAMTGTTADYSGMSIANAGDFNKDTYEDFLIGTSNSKAYLVFGTSTARTAALDLSSSSNAATSVLKFTFTSAGSSITATEKIIVSAAGDIDKDTYDDVAFGIPGWIGAGPTADCGIVIVYHGMASATITSTATLNVINIPIDTGASASQTKYFLIKDAHASTPAANKVGSSIASAGNINRDANGVDDILIGGPSTAGVVHIIVGTTTKRQADVDLSALSTNGFTLTGRANTLLGTYVAGVGDINGDTYPDAILGAPGSGLPGAYILYGQTSLATGTLATSGTSSAMLYNVITGAASTQLGQNVGACGDINNDGKNDFFVGAPKGGTANTQGKIYIVNGISTGAQIADISSFTSITTISGVLVSYLGWRSDGGTDINNDGVDDMIACAPFIDNSAASPSYSTEVGKCYVIYGKSSFPNLDLSSTTLSSSTSPAGFTITGVAGKAFGYDVSVVNDVTGDAGQDFIISAPQTGTTTGSVYLFYGVAPTTPTTSGLRLGASLLVFASFVAALMF